MYPKQVIRYISGDYTDEDKLFVDKWIKEDPARKQTLAELQKMWELTGSLKFGNEEEAWNKLRYRIERQKKAPARRKKVRSRKRKRSRRDYAGVNMFIKIAAILFITAGIALYMYSLSNYSMKEMEPEKRQTVYQTITSERGEQVHFRFKDGTKVILNAESKLTYSDTYGDSTRDLQLEGEAYFKVNHDHPIPFVVYAKSARVEDIGTEFNISAYPEQEKTDVVVAKGKVKVSARLTQSSNQSTSDSKKQPPSVILTEEEGVSVKEGAQALQIVRADLQKTMGWLEDRLLFDGEPLTQIINRLERRYKIEVEVADASLLDKKITASFIDESVENIAILLAESMEVDYSFENDTVRFFNKKETLKNNNNKQNTSQNNNSDK